MDCHATTPVDPRVLEAMLPYFTERFGNAASRSHSYGWEAAEAVDEARARVAALIGGRPKEIVFTSGATESDNLAIKGVLEAGGGHVVTCVTEHKAVLDSCKHLERQGVEVTYVGVGDDGRLDPDDVRRALRDSTVLCSVMLCNNEVGAIQPVAEIGRVLRERGVLFHCDAAQGVGLVPFDVEEANVDLASLSAHKLYGPKGVGALWVRRRTPRVRLVAQIDGGGHERSMRSGTLNVPGIVGFGRAAQIALEERATNAERVTTLRDRLHARLEVELADVHLNSPAKEHRHPGNLNVSFSFVEAEALMLALKDTVAVSSGAACTSASLEPSYVLRAMGIDEDRAHASVRFGLGRGNDETEVDTVADAVVHHVERLRELSPLYRLHREGTPVEW